LEKNRNRGEGRVASIGFLLLNNKKLYFIVFGLLFGIGSTTLSHSIYGNKMVDVSKKIVWQTQRSNIRLWMKI
jgi:hypothetical protein